MAFPELRLFSGGNTSIAKYNKQAWNLVIVFSLKCKQLFYKALNMSYFVPKK